MSTVAEEMRNPAMSAAPYGCNSIMTTILPSHSKLEVVFAHTSSVKSPTLHQESRVKSHTSKSPTSKSHTTTYKSSHIPPPTRVKSHTSKSHTSRSHTYKSPTHKSHTYKSHQESSHLPPSHLPTRVKSLPTSKSHTSSQQSSHIYQELVQVSPIEPKPVQVSVSHSPKPI